MTRLRCLLPLLLVGPGAALGLAGCDEDLINPMAARQPRVKAYGESDFYADGMAMREPPAGTVPRQRFTGNPAFTTGIATRSVKDGKETKEYVTAIPMKVDDAVMRLGQKRYNITCGTCHGPLGDGDSIVARQMALRPPPSLVDYANRPVGYIFEVASQGHGMMASYAAELPPPERWAVVAYIRALQVSRTATLDKVPVAERARLDNVKETP
jgi:mono/diheme cytochrome c family protein